MDIQKVHNGNDKIKFYEVDINKRALCPGDSFSMSLKYDSEIVYQDVEIDIVIYSSNEPGLHFQATNRAYNKEIHLGKGENELEIQIKKIMVNNAAGRVCITIWAKNRTELYSG
jgi:hypothetical protein